MDIRLQQLRNWISSELAIAPFEIEPASADASFRRYFRVTTGSQSYIAMDAPPEKEDVRPFLNAAEALSTVDVNVPEVFHENVEQGFLLLEDFGDRIYLDELLEEPESLYRHAIDALLKVQRGDTDNTARHIPRYDHDKLLEELDLFENWFINKHLGETLNADSELVLAQTKELLIEACLEQPQVWVHRDYHSRNLMITDSNSPGVIDFQDMVIGPIAYDLASIFKDCYIEWPRDRQLSWLAEYHAKAIQELALTPFSLDELIRWYDLTGLQRHLKVLGIFCRLNYRDGKEVYLGDLPLVASYTLEVLEHYPELKDFKDHFSGFVKQAL